MRAPIRQIAGVLLGAVLAFALFGYVFAEMVAYRRDVASQSEAALHDALSARVASWENNLLSDLDGWSAALSRGTDRAAIEARMREQLPMVVAAYVWMPVGESSQVRLLWPPLPPPEPAAGGRPCVRAAREVLGAEGTTAEDVVAAYEDGCGDEVPAVRLFAATEASHRLIQLGRADLALRLLERTGWSDTTLRGLIERGIAPRVACASRLVRAEALGALGDPDADEGLIRIAGEILSLPPQTAVEGSLTPYVSHPILSRLEQAGRTQDHEQIRRLLAEAEGRNAGYVEFKQRVVRPQTDPFRRFIRDQYGRADYLLYVDGSRANAPNVVVQLDGSKAVRAFLDSVTSRRAQIAVTDAAGTTLAGQRSGGPIAVSVPFAHTLTHLRVGFRQGTVDAAVARNDREIQWVVAALLVAVVLFVLVMVALLRANAIATSLLERQRDFTTRVTHELKTPLAGIRVTAENLAEGSSADPRRVRTQARRIIEEVDRLTERIDEVLDRNTERRPPDPIAFDPEEIVLEVVEQWGPRMEDAGIALTADLHPTAEVRGDPDAVRDAMACLLDNALKYHDAAKASREVRVLLHQVEMTVAFEVADNGLGVPLDRRRDIFDKYVRIEGPHRGLSGGHGLGLAQVAAIAAEHHGSVTCGDGFDGGARFVLRLPATGPAPSEEGDP